MNGPPTSKDEVYVNGILYDCHPEVASELERLTRKDAEDTKRSIERNTAYERDIDQLEAERDRLRAALDRIAKFPRSDESRGLGATACWHRMEYIAREALADMPADGPAERLPRTGAYAPSATCKHGVHPYDCRQGCDPHTMEAYTRDKVRKLRDFILSAPWFDPRTMACRDAIDVAIERLSVETPACICRPVGAGDGDTYVPDPRCKAHK